MKTIITLSQLLKATLLVLLSIGLFACQADQTSTEKDSDAGATDPVEAALTQIDESGLMQHINILASDEFAGRAPSTAGGKKTVAYLEQQFSALGLEPAFKDHSYQQAVELTEISVTNAPPLTIDHASGESDQLAYKESSVVFTSRTAENISVEDSPLVFVGYGVVAPEYNWNDYADIDMTGKTALILVNDPGFRAEDENLFKGNAMTYYGRWTYKFEEAARQGASAAIIIHEDKAAGYPWEVVASSWSGPQYHLYADDGNVNNLGVEAWIDKASTENLLTRLGLDYRELVEQAGSDEFNAVELDARVSTELQLDSRRSQSANVGAVIKGSERPDEMFLYTAHWDHLGIKPSDVENADVIYNGAQDNATGTAALIELAQAFKALPQAPERSIMFLAVTAEESGLLGSKHYAENPSHPLAQTVAGINIDGMSTYGATDDIVVVGFGNSEMDDYLRKVSAAQNREVVAEPTPEKGYFYRSDHFNLAKKGVPMLYAEAGIKVRDKPADYGSQEAMRYTAERYHKPGDEVHAEWDNGGILQDLQAHFRIGEMISNSNDWPKWSEGNEFQAIRQASRATPD